MATPSQIITLRAPDLAAAQAARIPDLIVEAEAQTGPVFGNHRNTAVAYLVLHWLALEARGTAAAPGAITGEREGDLSRSYVVGAARDVTDLRSTTWGSQLLRLRDATIFAARNRLTVI